MHMRVFRYYNMLTLGDADELRTLFSAFAKTMTVAHARTNTRFLFEGLCWPEYTTVFYGARARGVF